MNKIRYGTINILKTGNEFVAREIVQLQQEAYRVEAELIGSSCIPPLYDTVENIKNTDEVFLGYKVNRELVGLLSYKLEYGILDIHRLAVKPEHFKKGIGRALLKNVIESNPDAKRVIVATGAQNGPAIGLYESMGFKITRMFEVEQGLTIAQLALEDRCAQTCAYRGEEEMLKLITDYAQEQEDIHAVLMNGSRTNSKVQKDRFQDYDIVYVVDDPMRYRNNRKWIENFGTTLIIQQNDIEMDGFTYCIFLMQFSDGNRIDLSFFPKGYIRQRETDTLERVLLDKGDLFQEKEAANDSIYYTHKPEADYLLERINNIFWCSTNIVKGLCRGELNYAKRMQEQIIRSDLNELMRMYISCQKDWKVNTGVFGKWMQAYLTHEEWEVYLETCAGCDPQDIWSAMNKMIDLASYYGRFLTEALGLVYPDKDEAGIRQYVQMNRKYFERRVNCP